MVFQLILGGNRLKKRKKIEKSTNRKILRMSNLVYFPETRNEIRISKTERLLSKKLFWIVQKFYYSGQFLTQNLGLTDEFWGFSGFSDFFSTFGYHNFFFTEPILKNLYILKSILSESFISAILEAQNKIRVPPDTHLWREFCKNGIHSPTNNSWNRNRLP